MSIDTVPPAKEQAMTAKARNELINLATSAVAFEWLEGRIGDEQFAAEIDELGAQR